MKKIILLLTFSFINTLLFSQQKEDAEKLVDEGIAYHDKGDYDGAISKYDKALGLDKDNLFALTEKAYSLLYLQKYDESINYCQKAIEIHPGDKGLKTVYVTYGNALDGLKKTDQSIEVYDEGIKQFPNYFYLYFNKGITLASVKKYDESILCFQKSVALNPAHASSHNAIAQLLNIENKTIPSLLAYCRFLVVEPEGNRAKANLANLQKIMKANVKETGAKSVTISINADMLDDITTDGKLKENSFTSTELILQMDAALDYDNKNKKETEVERFVKKMETVCGSLKETKGNNYGFYWNYYVPYFIEMKDKKFCATFAYITFAPSGSPDVLKWLKSHKDDIDKFYDWSKNYVWK